MADIIAFPLKKTYERTLREQSLTHRYSKGYPAVQDPAAENPHGVLPKTLTDAALYKMRLRYGPPVRPLDF